MWIFQESKFHGISCGVIIPIKKIFLRAFKNGGKTLNIKASRSQALLLRLIRRRESYGSTRANHRDFKNVDFIRLAFANFSHLLPNSFTCGLLPFVSKLQNNVQKRDSWRNISLPPFCAYSS